VIARSCSIASLFFFKISLFSGDPELLDRGRLWGLGLQLPTRIATEKPLEWISAANAVALLESKAKMIAFTILTRKIAVVQLNRAPSVR